MDSARGGAAWDMYIFREIRKKITRNSNLISALVPVRDQRAKSTAILVTKEVSDANSPSLTAFLHLAYESEFLAQFSSFHYVDSSAFIWTAHPCFRLRKPIPDRPADSAPAVLHTAILDARNYRPHLQTARRLHNGLGPLHRRFQPARAATTEKRKSPLFPPNHLTDSDAQLWYLLPGTDPTRPPRLRKVPSEFHTASHRCSTQLLPTRRLAARALRRRVRPHQVQKIGFP